MAQDYTYINLRSEGLSIESQRRMPFSPCKICNDRGVNYASPYKNTSSNISHIVWTVATVFKDDTRSHFGKESRPRSFASLFSRHNHQENDAMTDEPSGGWEQSGTPSEFLRKKYTLRREKRPRLIDNYLEQKRIN